MRRSSLLAAIVLASMLFLIASGCSGDKDPNAPPGAGSAEPETPKTGCTVVFVAPGMELDSDETIKISVTVSGELGTHEDGKVIIDVIPENPAEISGAIYGVLCAPEKALTFEAPAGLGKARLAGFYVTQGGPSVEVPAALTDLMSFGTDDMTGIELNLAMGADFGSLAEMYQNRSEVDPVQPPVKPGEQPPIDPDDKPPVPPTEESK